MYFLSSKNTHLLQFIKFIYYPFIKLFVLDLADKRNPSHMVWILKSDTNTSCLISHHHCLTKCFEKYFCLSCVLFTY